MYAHIKSLNNEDSEESSNNFCSIMPVGYRTTNMHEVNF